MTNEQAELLTTDRGFQRLKYYQEKTNVFTIVGQTHTEHWHSSFISWLLDPNSSLCLGHYPVARLLNLYLIKNPEHDFTLQALYDLDLDQLHFVTEKTFFTADGKKRSIDVYGESDELVIVIENKVKALENYNGSETGQTKDYFEYVEANKKTGQRTFYFFITPDPKQKSFDEGYTQITYQEMYDNIIAKCMEHPQINKDGKYLLEQYANNLREPVHHSPMALVNVDLCKDIYERHQEVLDEIYADVQQASSVNTDGRLTCVLYRHYQSILDEIYLSLDEKYGKTPNALLHRQIITFTDLYKEGKITDGMPFTMEYAGAVFHAVTEYHESEQECFLLVLDENGQPYRNAEGKKIGYYRTSSQAGVDAINLYRKKKGIEEKVLTLRGTTYWKTSDGRTLKDLIDSI